jgi:guanylate kinase
LTDSRLIRYDYKITEMKNHKLFILVGPSGVGKNAVLKGVIEKISNLKIFPSYTTRQIRKGEKEGREHFFITDKKFKELIDKKMLLEHEEVHPGLFYGIPSIDKLEPLLEKYNLIRDVDVLGAQSLKKVLPEKLVIIFIKPPSLEELKNRILKRGELSPKQIEERLSRIPFEMKKIDLADYQVINDKLEKCVDDVVKIIKKEISQED